MNLIVDSASIKDNATYLKPFQEVYEAGFPDENEREIFSDILDRISGISPSYQPPSIIIIKTDNEIVSGGLIVDWYKDCQTVHLTYLIVNPNFRNQGIAKSLINEGIKEIIDWIEREKKIKIKNVFFESNNPSKTLNDNFDPTLRLKIFTKLGAKLIDFPYVQPPLDEKKDQVENLFLLSFTQFNAGGDKIPGKEIQCFLLDFYKGLGVDDQHPAYIKMVKFLESMMDKNGDIKLSELELPLYQFKKASVTYHFIEETDHNCNKEENCDFFHSFETDLLNYQHQQHRPFCTIYKEYHQSVKLIFPRTYRYTSEGISHIMIANRECLNVKLSVSVSIIIKTNIKIFHVTITPAKDDYFSELDLIRLSTQFGSLQENFSQENEIMISLGKEEISTVGDMLRRHFSDNNRIKPLKTGIVQMDLSSFYSGEKVNFDRFFELFFSGERVVLDEENDGIKHFSKILCGIILGIFDFERMDDEEIYDTIIPIVKHLQSFVVVFRGSLLKISTEEFFQAVPDELIVSPYLLIPNMVLTYNEYLLDKAVKTLNRDKRKKSNLEILEDSKIRINDILNIQYLQDVFQYPSEQAIIERGNEQRSIVNKFQNVLKRTSNLLEEINKKRSDRSNRAEALLAAIMVFFPIMSVRAFFMETFRFKYIWLFFTLAATILAVTVYFISRSKRK